MFGGKLLQPWAWGDTLLSFFIHKAWVCVDLWIVVSQTKMIQNGLNEKQVCIAYNPQFTPENEFHATIYFTLLNRKTLQYMEKKQRKREICRYPKAWAALTLSTMYQQLLLVFFYMSRVSLKPLDPILGGFM